MLNSDTLQARLQVSYHVHKYHAIPRHDIPCAFGRKSYHVHSDESPTTCIWTKVLPCAFGRKSYHVHSDESPTMCIRTRVLPRAWIPCHEYHAMSYHVMIPCEQAHEEPTAYVCMFSKQIPRSCHVWISCQVTQASKYVLSVCQHMNTMPSNSSKQTRIVQACK